MKITASLAVIALLASLIPAFWPTAPLVFILLVCCLVCFIYADHRADLEAGISLEQKRYEIAKKARDMEIEAQKAALETERYREIFDKIAASRERSEAAEAFITKIRDIALDKKALNEIKKATSEDNVPTLFEDDVDEFEDDDEEDDNESYDEDDDEDVEEEEGKTTRRVEVIPPSQEEMKAINDRKETVERCLHPFGKKIKPVYFQAPLRRPPEEDKRDI